MKGFGKTFKYIRESKCLTQKHVAGSDLSRSLYVKIEKGEVVPSFTKFNAIVKRLNMTHEEFFCTIPIRFRKKLRLLNFFKRYLVSM